VTPVTSEADRQRLLRIARDALTGHLTGAVPAATPIQTSAVAGVFVTLHKEGELRGCIGCVDAHEPLAHVVPRYAVAAGTADPRFPALTIAELSLIVIELSILGPLEPVASVEEIEVGRHGLVVEADGQRGLLLPQVATEWRWDRHTFVAQTCRKAGLPLDAWTKGARVWRFEAEVFSE